VKLVPIDIDDDMASLAAKLAPAFGGDPEPARELLAQTLDLLTRDPRPQPWGSYLVHEGEAIGIGAFKTAPSDAGEVEIAYMTFPAFERRGHATVTVAALTAVAFAAGVPTVIAHTLPEENASNSALRRNGFVFAGEVDDPEDGLVWRWEKRNG
jgi:RimJ/RimL family protein N-acetyltransferase